jgi:hypothetical protein
MPNEVVFRNPNVVGGLGVVGERIFLILLKIKDYEKI